MNRMNEDKMMCLEPGCNGEMETRRLKTTVGDPLDNTQELVIVFTRAMSPPSFECNRCGKIESFYQAHGRRMMKVKPLK